MLSRLSMSKMMCTHITCPSAVLQLVRNASTNLFVGGLSYDTNETVLRDAFKQHGEIIEVRVICHHVNGNSKGYGFVKFASEDSAASALKDLDGQVSFQWLRNHVPTTAILDLIPAKAIWCYQAGVGQEEYPCSLCSQTIIKLNQHLLNTGFLNQ